MATRKVKTPRQRQQERKEQMQREQTVEKIISAMTETVTRLQTVSAWAQWQNNAEAMTKGSHEATRSSSEQELGISLKRHLVEISIKNYCFWWGDESCFSNSKNLRPPFDQAH